MSEHILLKEMIIITLFSPLEQRANQRVQISHDNLLSFTNWMIEDAAFDVPKQPQMLAQPPYSL